MFVPALGRRRQFFWSVVNCALDTDSSRPGAPSREFRRRLFAQDARRMANAYYGYYESREAREKRELYNLLRGGGEENEEEKILPVELPTPAGSLYLVQAGAAALGIEPNDHGGDDAAGGATSSTSGRTRKSSDAMRRSQYNKDLERLSRISRAPVFTQGLNEEEPATSWQRRWRRRRSRSCLRPSARARPWLIYLFVVLAHGRATGRAGTHGRRGRKPTGDAQ